MKPTEDDLLAIIDYVDGRLSTDEMIALELRMGEDPDLARAFESFAGMEHLQRAVLEGQRPRFRFLSGRRRLGAVVAAAAAVLLLLLWWWGPTTSPATGPSFRVAVMRSAATPSEYNRVLGLGEAAQGTVPASFFTMRGGGEEAPPGAVSDAEYLALVASRQERAGSLALQGAREAATFDFFALPFRASKTGSVVVLLLGTDGRVHGARPGDFEAAFPRRRPWTAASGHVEAEREYILPRPPVALPPSAREGGEEAIFAPGCVVPQGDDRLQVLVGFRAAPLDAGLEANLHGILESLREAHAIGEGSLDGSRATLHTWLAEHEFEAVELTVQGPAD